jgi:hypothetical protein
MRRMQFDQHAVAIVNARIGRINPPDAAAILIVPNLCTKGA